MQGNRNDIGSTFLEEARTRLKEGVDLIRHCVDQLDDQGLWRRPRPEMNSIGNLLLHLAGNLRQRFRSDVGGEPDSRDRYAEFTERRMIPKDELSATFEAAAADALSQLRSMSPEMLGEPRTTHPLSGDAETTVLGIIFQAVSHLIGHAQEIVQMTRLQLEGSYRFRSPAGVPPAMRPQG